MKIAKQIRIQKLQDKNRMVGSTFNPSGITSEQLKAKENSILEMYKNMTDTELLETYNKFKQIEDWKEKDNLHFSNTMEHNLFMNNYRYMFENKENNMSEKLINTWNEIPDILKVVDKVNPLKKVELTPKSNSLMSLFGAFVSTDETRPNFTGVYFDKDVTVATDAHKLFIYPETNKQFEGKIIDLKSGTEIKDTPKFPDYKILFKEKKITAQSKFSIYDCRQLNEIALLFTNQASNLVVYKLDNKQVGFKGQFLNYILESFLKLGYTDLYISKVESTKPDINSNFYIFTPEKYAVGKFNQPIALLMPMMIESDDETTDWNDRTGSAADIDFGYVLNAYFDFDKNKIISDGKEYKIDLNLQAKTQGNLTIQQQKTLASLNTANKKNTLPILDWFLVDNGDIRVFNLETDIKIKKTGLKDGFYRYTKALIREEYQQDKDYYPITPDVKTKIGTVNTKELVEKLKNAFIHSGNDELRPVMNGVLFDFDQELTYTDNEVALVSSDSNSMFIDFIDIETKNKVDFILPKNKFNFIALNALESENTIIYKDSEGKENIRNVRFISGNFEIITRVIEGEYPKYKSVLPDRYENSVSFNFKDFKDILPTKKLSDYIISFDFDNNEVQIIDYKNEWKIISKKKINFNEASEKSIKGVLLMPRQDQQGILSFGLQKFVETIKSLDTDIVNFRYNGLKKSTWFDVYQGYANSMKDLKKQIKKEMPIESKMIEESKKSKKSKFKEKYYSTQSFDTNKTELKSQTNTWIETDLFRYALENPQVEWNYILEVPNKHIPYDYVILEIPIKNKKFPYDYFGLKQPLGKNKEFEKELNKYSQNKELEALYKQIENDLISFGLTDKDVIISEMEEAKNEPFSEYSPDKDSNLYGIAQKLLAYLGSYEKIKNGSISWFTKIPSIPDNLAVKIYNGYHGIKDKTKQPYEMTKMEYINSNYYTTFKKKIYEGKSIPNVKDLGSYAHKKAMGNHKELIETAISEGKTIPIEVQKEYPELFERDLLTEAKNILKQFDFYNESNFKINNKYSITLEIKEYNFDAITISLTGENNNKVNVYLQNYENSILKSKTINSYVVEITDLYDLITEKLKPELQTKNINDMQMIRKPQKEGQKETEGQKEIEVENTDIFIPSGKQIKFKNPNLIGEKIIEYLKDAGFEVNLSKYSDSLDINYNDLSYNMFIHPTNDKFILDKIKPFVKDDALKVTFDKHLKEIVLEIINFIKNDVGKSEIGKYLKLDYKNMTDDEIKNVISHIKNEIEKHELDILNSKSNDLKDWHESFINIYQNSLEKINEQTNFKTDLKGNITNSTPIYEKSKETFDCFNTLNEIIELNPDHELKQGKKVTDKVTNKVYEIDTYNETEINLIYKPRFKRETQQNISIGWDELLSDFKQNKLEIEGYTPEQFGDLAYIVKQLISCLLLEKQDKEIFETKQVSQSLQSQLQKTANELTQIKIQKEQAENQLKEIELEKQKEQERIENERLRQIKEEQQLEAERLRIESEKSSKLEVLETRLELLIEMISEQKNKAKKDALITRKELIEEMLEDLKTN